MVWMMLGGVKYACQEENQCPAAHCLPTSFNAHRIPSGGGVLAGTFGGVGGEGVWCLARCTYAEYRVLPRRPCSDGRDSNPHVHVTYSTHSRTFPCLKPHAQHAGCRCVWLLALMDVTATCYILNTPHAGCRRMELPRRSSSAGRHGRHQCCVRVAGHRGPSGRCGCPAGERGGGAGGSGRGDTARDVPGECGAAG